MVEELRLQLVPLYRWVRNASDRAFQWRTLLTILDSRLFSTMYIWLLIVPSAAKFLQKAPERVKVQPFGSQPLVELSLELPFSWVVLYAAAAVFVSARLIYVLFCPKFIRDYSNAGEAQVRGLTVQYIASELRDFMRNYFRRSIPLTNTENDNLEDILAQYRIDSSHLIMMRQLSTPIGEELSEQLERKLITEDSARPDRYRVEGNGGLLIVEKEQFFKHVFWDLHRFQDTSYPIARAVCSLLVVVGAICICYVAIEGAMFVVEVVLK
jgi:hypothetical protein